jgi:hypothetical protein
LEPIDISPRQIRVDEIDFTQLQTYINCPRYYFNRYHLCLNKLDDEDDTIDFRFGSAYHRAEEEFYKTGDILIAVDMFRSLYVDTLGEVVKTVDNGVETLRQYAEYFKHNFSEWKFKSLEQRDSVEVGGVKYLVKIDSVIEWNGQMFVVDRKTTRSKNKVLYMMSFEPHLQPLGYYYYVSKKYGNCSGFIPNVAFMGHRQRAYKGEPSGFHVEFDYRVVNYAPQDLARFEQMVGYWVSRINNDKEFCGNFSQCHFSKKVDGEQVYKPCPFRDLCLSCNDESVLESKYEVIDPKAYLNKEA